MTLNLLHTFHTKPKLSDYVVVFGIHDFNQCPLEPPVTKVTVNEKTDNCRSWSLRGIYGWYIVPSMEQYRCVKCFMPYTSSVFHVGTFTFSPADIPLTKMDTEDYLRQSIGYILVIMIKLKTQLPFLTYGDTTTSTVESTTKILQREIPCTPPVIPTNDPTPTPEQTITVPEQIPMNVTTISPTMPPVPVQVQRVPTVSPTMTPVQVHRVPLKYPGGTTISCRKALPM